MQAFRDDFILSQEELEARYEENWNAYMQAIAEPWNKFITKSDEIDDEAV